MLQFQFGTVEAFDILVSRYRDPLMSYIYRFLGDMKEGEDLLQETFLRLYRNRHSYRRIARFSTWLYTIAGNLARSEYRKRKRRRLYSIQSINRDAEEYEVEIPDETFSPDRHTESMLQDKYIQEALHQIPEEFREVVVLRDVQQLAYEEIALITGLPMGTVKQCHQLKRLSKAVIANEVKQSPEISTVLDVGDRHASLAMTCFSLS